MRKPHALVIEPWLEITVGSDGMTIDDLRQTAIGGHKCFSLKGRNLSRLSPCLYSETNLR